jgi:hypothetical protein
VSANFDKTEQRCAVGKRVVSTSNEKNTKNESWLNFFLLRITFKKKYAYFAEQSVFKETKKSIKREFELKFIDLCSKH